MLKKRLFKEREEVKVPTNQSQINQGGEDD